MSVSSSTTRRLPLRSIRSSAQAPVSKFNDIVQFVSSSEDVPQKDRIMTLISRVTEDRTSAFSVTDALNGLSEGMKLCESMCGEYPAEFVPHAVAMLEMCALPVEMQTVQDEPVMNQAIVSVINVVCSVLENGHDDVRITAANTLRRVVRHIRDVCFDDCNAPPANMTEKRKTMHKAIGDSQLIPAVLQALSRVSQTTSPLEETLLLKALLECSHYATLCELMVSHSLLDVVSGVLLRCPWGDRRVISCTEVTWNVLELYPDARTAQCHNTNDSGETNENNKGNDNPIPLLLRALKHQYELALVTGYKVRDKEARNDLLMVLTHLATPSENAGYFLDTGLTDLFVLVACGAELALESEVLKPFVLTMGEEDFQMKKLLLHMIFLVGQSEENLHLVLDLQVMPVLLSYIDVTCTTNSVIRWPTIQLIDLQTQILGILCHLCVQGQDEFRECNGSTIVITFLENCVDLDPALRAMTLRVLCNLATTSNRTTLAEHNVIPMMLHILSDAQSSVEAKTDCFQIISDIVYRNPQLQEAFYAHGGVAYIVPFMSYDIGIRTPAVELLVSTVCDCVWNCIAGCDAAEAEFLDMDGLFALLNVLADTHDASAQLPILGVLCDLLHSTEAQKEFRQWKSKDGHSTGVQLLLTFWSQEQDQTSTVEGTVGLKALGLSLDLKGNTTRDDFAAPPHCVKIYGDYHHGLPTLPNDVATMGTLLSRRLKIFCALEYVGFGGHIELFPAQRKLLLIVQAFAELCHDELWVALADALRAEEVDFIPQDSEKLRVVLDEAERNARELFSTQSTLQAEHEKWVVEQEITFYKSLIKHTEKTADAAKGAKNPIAKKGMSITEAKMKKAQMLKQSFKQALESHHDDEDEEADEHHPKSPALARVPHPPSSAAATAPEDAATEAGNTDPTGQSITYSRQSARLGATEGQQYLTVLEHEIFRQINVIRTNPTSYVPHIEQVLERLGADNIVHLPGSAPDDVGEVSVEGREAYEQTIQFLQATAPVEALLDTPIGMNYSCEELALELMHSDTISSDGTEGLATIDRLKRYGVPSSRVAQSMALTREDAVGIVLQLLVCDGIKTRIDRSHLFSDLFRYVGIAVAPHVHHRRVTVVQYAVEFTNRTRDEQRKSRKNAVAASVAATSVKSKKQQ
eukprot:PhM_4_TR7030/c0_g1_i1/m.23816